MRRAAVRILGKLAISVGAGILLFVAWEYWGTGLATGRAQERLADELDVALDDALRQDVETIARPFTGPPPGFDPAPGEPVFRIKIPAIDLNDGKGSWWWRASATTS